MDVLKMTAAGAQSFCCLESSLPAGKTATSPSSSSSISAVDCSAFGASKREKNNLSSCAPLGLSGDGLSSGVRRSNRLSFSASSSPSYPASSSPSSSSSSSSSRPRLTRVSRLASPPRSAAAAAPVVQSLEGEPLLKDIDTQDLEAETPLLLQQCSDMDWKTLVDDLRSEVLHGLQSSGLRALSLKALEKLMESWIHEQMVDGIERPTAAKLPSEDAGWSLEAATSDLRMEANLQAAQMLAKGVDSTFDWETDVAELHQRILLQGGAEPSVPVPEQRLWQAWAHARGQVVESSNKLAEEALASSSVNGKAESIDGKPQAAAEEAVGDSLDSTSSGSKDEDGKSLLSLGAAVATGLAVEGIWLADALADVGGPDAVEAASRAPSWLVPAVLVFPPLSYFLFNVYRDRVNPYARVTDWMFGVVAVTIVSNLVMMAVWGVRLY